MLENAGALTITGTTSYTVNGALETVLTQTLDAVASDGSAVTFAVTEGTLPAGLTLNGNTISGTPTATASTTVKITATAGTASLVISVTFLIADAPEPMYYGCINDGTTYKVSQITADMLTADTVTEADARTLTATVSQTMGGVLFVLIPADAGLTARKDDGVGNKVPFDEDIGATGTGANGIDLTLNGTAYKAYGEFSLIDADTIIYIGG